MSRFNQQIIQLLNDYVEPHLDLPVFHDRRYIDGGAYFDDGLAEALSGSVCMILVYTQTYFEKRRPYCTQEFCTMKNIEKYRQRVIGARESFIIPVILKGEPPLFISREMSCNYDFNKWFLTSPPLETNQEWAEWFDSIGRRIRFLYDKLYGIEGEHDCIKMSPKEEAIEFIDNNKVYAASRFPRREGSVLVSS